MQEQVFRIRFGLRGMILGLTILGVGTGLLGKLFFSNFPVFVSVTTALFTVAPFLLAVGTLIRLGWKHGQRSLTAWGILLLATPVCGLGLLALLQTWTGPSMDGLGIMSNRQLIHERIGKDGDAPRIWRELERRVRLGKISNQEVDQAFEQLVAFMKAKQPGGWNQPLSWQDDFVRASRKSNLVSDRALLSLCDTYHGAEPKISPIDIQASSRPIEVRVDYGTPWDRDTHSGLGIHHLWTVRSLEVDGIPVELERTRRFAQSWRGTISTELPAMPQRMTALVEIAYVDSAKMIGLSEDSLPLERWPVAMKRWTKSVTIPLDGSTEANRVFRLVTDLARRPVGEVSVGRLVVQQDEGGLQMLILQLDYADGLTIPVSFDVLADFDDETHLLGTSWACSYQSNGGSGRMSAGSLLTSRGQRIHPLVAAADITLRPNIQPIRDGLKGASAETKDIDEIWGKPILLRDVPMERLDLEMEGTDNESR